MTTDDELLLMVDEVRRAMKTSPDVRAMFVGAMQETGTANLIQLTRNHLDRFEILYDAMKTMLDEIPEETLGGVVSKPRPR